jgi:hypothetical protein
VVLCAAEAVREAITTVFRRFDELGSARQVLIRLRADGVLLPRQRNGAKRIFWAQATYPAVPDVPSVEADEFAAARQRIVRWRL